MKKTVAKNTRLARVPGLLGRVEPDWLCVGLLIVGFVLSRWLAVRAGVVATGGLPHLQAADRDLLSNDWLRTLLLLHIQPPLFNGFLGLLLKLPLTFSKLVSISYQGLGLLLSIVMFSLLRRVQVGRVLALVATVLFAISPASLLYETFTIYTYPCAFLLLSATYFVQRYGETGHRRDALAVSLLVAAAALVRSLLHLVWAVGALVLVLFLPARRKRRAVWLLLPAITLVSAVYLKNLVLFDTFGTSTLVGQSLYRISTQVIDLDVRLQLVEEGRISPFALMAPNRPVAHYPLQRSFPERIELGSWDARAFLAQGWSRTPEGKGQFRWSTAERSILVIPIEVPGDLTLVMRVAPFRFPGAPEQSIRVRVAGETIDELALQDAVSTYEVSIPQRLLRTGLNTVTFGYGYWRSPRELGLSRDSRTLAVRWYSIDSRFLPARARRSPAEPEKEAVGRPWMAEAPVLTRILKEDGGSNPNHARMPALMETYRTDALTLVREFPLTYMRSVGRAYLITLASPTEHPAFHNTRPRIESWDRLYSAVVYGARNKYWGPDHSHNSRWLPTRELTQRVSWHYLLAALVLIPFSVYRWIRHPHDPRSVTLLFAVFNIAWVIVVGNFLDYGENNRFRMLVEPLIWVVLVVSFSEMMQFLGARIRDARAGDRAAREG